MIVEVVTVVAIVVGYFVVAGGTGALIAKGDLIDDGFDAVLAGIFWPVTLPLAGGYLAVDRLASWRERRRAEAIAAKTAVKLAAAKIVERGR